MYRVTVLAVGTQRMRMRRKNTISHVNNKKLLVNSMLGSLREP